MLRPFDRKQVAVRHLGLRILLAGSNIFYMKLSSAPIANHCFYSLYQKFLYLVNILPKASINSDSRSKRLRKNMCGYMLYLLWKKFYCIIIVTINYALNFMIFVMIQHFGKICLSHRISKPSMSTSICERTPETFMRCLKLQGNWPCFWAFNFGRRKRIRCPFSCENVGSLSFSLTMLKRHFLKAPFIMFTAAPFKLVIFIITSNAFLPQHLVVVQSLSLSTS